MKILHTLALSLAVATAPAGCDRDTTASTEAVEARDSTEGSIESNLSSAMNKVRDELATENISLDGPAGAPKAEITPEGELLIDGRAVQVTDDQRRLLLDYRARVVEVASAGAQVGIEGARLGVRAAGEALRGVFSGNADEVGKRVEAQAESIRTSALALCDRLPAMYDAQQALATALPEFAPYAKMERSDIEDCRVDARSDAPPAPPAAPTPPDPAG